MVALQSRCKMDSVRRTHLCLYLMVCLGMGLSRSRANLQGVSRRITTCSFPSFLQESCLEASKHCRHWSQGKRITHVGTSVFHKVTNDGGRARSGERTWIFQGGKVDIFTVESRDSQQLYCWQKLAPHIFIVSSKNTTSKTDSNVKYSCFRFRKRGRNVIGYEQTAWKVNHTSVVCNASDLVINDNPLILNTFEEVADCPAELNGGFQIMQLFNGETDKQCLYDNTTDSAAIFESDCLGKEGLVIQVPEQKDCFLRKEERAIDIERYQLVLYCYSAAWNDRRFTYFIVKRQLMRRDAFSDSLESDFLCARLHKVIQESGEEFQLEIYNQPTCWRTRKVIADSILLRMNLKRKVNVDEPVRFPSEINETKCSFPNQFQGVWKEISQHNKLQTVIINKTEVIISPYGKFHCKQQHIFQRQAPYKCSSLVTGRWPGRGRAKFHIDDYLLISTFSNGCRPRVTRFGVTNIIENDVLIYRMSQSVPLSSVPNSEEYFRYHVQKHFCSSWLPYVRDPHPIWGRNIEKIITKHPTRIQLQCPLPTQGRGVYHFKTVYGNQSGCNGPASRVQFGCDIPFKFNAKYDPSCHLSDVSFTCLGKAWKLGEFFLIRNDKTELINCMWYDTDNNQLLRLNSPQCSDIDWMKTPGKERNYAEKFVLQYYSKCPLVSDSRTIDYPIIIRRRSSSSNFRVFPGFVISSSLLLVTLFF